jgi:hypothetical protein
MPDQIIFRELLEDKVFKAWFNRIPKTQPPPSLHRPPKPAWVVYVQRERDGGWARARFHKYTEAHRYVSKHYKKVWDLALGCHRRDYGPPLIVVSQNGHKRNALWRGVPEGHQWCGYCRRPTVFRFFSFHHSLGSVADYEPRCSICGVRAVFLKNWYRQ